LRDGAAMVRFLAWLDREAPSGTVDEIAAVKRLEAFRRETNALREISFDTIAGSGPHGAIVHYRVTEATNRTLRPGELFLVDSGGQYVDGTTDITRTVAIGASTPEMRERFTLVLKGHIAIATARFPRGVRGIDLDPLARAALWAHGLDYDHGTGHGVGSYLSVHEGPQSISKAGMVALEPGMICSNEPGYYKAGAYGIRIENLVLVTEPETLPGADRATLSFETLTLCPVDRRLVVPEMLSPAERAWLDSYHARVRENLAPLVDEATRAWLAQATAKL
jgi:Xaa-Pro aminopeptidase